MRKLFMLATALGSVATAVPAAATLMLGNTVTVRYLFPDQNTVVDSSAYTVGTSSPFTFSGITSISLTDTQITLNAFCGSGCTWTATTFNGWSVFDSNNSVAPFTAVTINAATNYAGFDASRVSFDANNIYVNWQGLDANGTIVLDVTGGAVPEPASWAMLIAGFGLVGAAARRRRLKTA